MGCGARDNDDFPIEFSRIKEGNGNCCRKPECAYELPPCGSDFTVAGAGVLCFPIYTSLCVSHTIGCTPCNVCVNCLQDPICLH
jgi:hypothetical protein